MRPKPRPNHSYRDAVDIPDFDDSRVLLVMDGNCGLCSSAARRIARADHGDRIRITTAGSTLGQGLLRHYGMDPADPQSWLLVENGQAFGSLDAILRLAPRLYRILAPVAVLRLLPMRVQDWLYARLARNRYAIFGRGDLCAMPDEALRKRLIL